MTAEHPEVAATLARHLDSMDLQKASERADAGQARCRSARAAAGPRLRRRGRLVPPPGGPGRVPDPKDGLPLLQELLQAQTDRDAGRLDAAASRLEALAERDPREPGGLRGAIVRVRPPQGHRGSPQVRKRAVALDPESAIAVMDLAFAFQAAGRRDEAATGFERVLSLDPENLKALLNLGEIHHARGDREKAFELYQRAVAAAPRLARAQIALAAWRSR